MKWNDRFLSSDEYIREKEQDEEKRKEQNC
jgi:hypothetical protein